MDGVKPSQCDYLKRQTDRIRTGLNALNQRFTALSNDTPLSDGELRLACYLSWGLFRARIQLNEQPQLQALLQRALTLTEFRQTEPPAAAAAPQFG